MIKTTGDNDLIKNLNLGIVLDAIRDNGPLSRAEISRSTGLSRSTCSLLVDRLLEDKLVMEVGKDESSGGRKPVLLELNYHAGLAVGVKVLEDGIQAVLAGPDGLVIETCEIVLIPESLQDAYVSGIIDVVENLMTYQDKSDDSRPVLGIGIGIGGRIDYDAGVLLESSILPFDNLPLGALLESRFGIPVYLENDVNTFAIGEKYLGEGRPYRNFLCLSIGRGIGVGIIVDNKLYRGSHHGAGEFGHMKMMLGPDAPKCTCGQSGCLEALASDPAICRLVRERTSESPDIKEIRKRAAAGDRICLNAMEEAGSYLGLGISNLINLFDPEIIIIGGEGTAGSEFLIPSMKEQITKNTAYGLHKGIEIIHLDMDDHLWTRGVATLVFREVYRIPV